MDSILDIARWQFGIITVYHFLFVPLTIGLSALVAGYETAWVRTGNARVPAADEVLRQALPDQLRHRRGHRHRAGVPVRHELERLLAVRRRRLRRPAGDRGAARVLPRVDVPRPVDLRLGPAAPRAALRLHLDRAHRHAAVGVLHPGRQLVDAAPGRLHVQPRHRPRRADRLRRGADQQGAAGDVPAHHHRGVPDRRRRSSLGVAFWLHGPRSDPDADRRDVPHGGPARRRGGAGGRASASPSPATCRARS